MMPKKGDDRFTRRFFLESGSALTAVLAATAAPWRAAAQDVALDAGSQQFSFDILTAQMRALATLPHVSVEAAPSFLDDLDYDDYRLVRFRPDRARWAVPDSLFRLQAFSLGWLFKEPVLFFEVQGDQATLLSFSTDDFEFLNDLATRVPPQTEVPGVAGFRLHHPLNRPDIWDEVAAFLGASYFRALGRGNSYGLSARGLGVNTGLSSEPEEFPRFSRFYLERPDSLRETITLFAALEGASVTGAYRFVITPGAETVMEVTARLFFRSAVTQLGIAPLTSMFLFSQQNRHQFDDYRPNVHDSDGLRIVRSDGDVIWRPLNNPVRLAGSYLTEVNPRSFGLHQRDRDFVNYQDPTAQYERRPSLDVEPIGDWGRGIVRLFEIPTDLEINDNIVAFWIPEGPVAAGEEREFAYRLLWGGLSPEPGDARAWVAETRSGVGGVSGVEAVEGVRKFVIDFRGGLLAELGEGAPVEAVTSITGGQIETQVLSPIPQTDTWRLVIDVAAQSGAVVELGAHVAGFGRKLTEQWLYQWVVA